MVKDTKLYDILEISPTATDEEIKQSYRRLSKLWHPDRNPNNKDEATKKFQEISEAYNVLKDKQQREMYDMSGSTENAPNFDPNEMFEHLFGGAFGGGPFGGGPFGGGPFGGGPFGQRQRRPDIEDCIVEQNITLEELFSNKKITINYKQKKYCTQCNGTGSKDGKTHDCNTCNGQGKTVRVIRQGPMIQQLVAPCNDCMGSGKKVDMNNICESCNGMKHLMNDINFELQLNRNMSNNDKIVIEDKGHIMPNGTGRLIIVLHEQPHPVFKRHGKDLHMDIKLRLFQSLFGFTKMITHLDGRNLMVQNTHLANNMLSHMNTTMVIPNEGMNGDLYLHITTSMPKMDRLDETERSALRKILIKAHLSEYQKELNIIKNSDKFIKVTCAEIEPVNDNEPERPEFEGVGCAQQ